MLGFGHSGDDNDQLDETPKLNLIKLQQEHDVLYQKCHKLKGLPSAEHGIGTVKVKYFNIFNAAIQLENRLMMQKIKRDFDQYSQ